MLQLRARDTLGGADRNWLGARHHFAVYTQGNLVDTALRATMTGWSDNGQTELLPPSE